MPTPKETVIRTADKIRKGDKIVGKSVKNFGKIIRVTSVKKTGGSYQINFSDGDWTNCIPGVTFEVVTR